MATGYSAEATGVLDGTLVPDSKSDGRSVDAKVRAFIATFDLSLTNVKKANGDINYCFRVPRGYRFLYGLLNGSATMGANATIAIGTVAVPAKYRAAATFTAAAPTLFGKSTGADDVPLTDYEDVIITVGHADGLPSDQVLLVQMFYSAR